MKAYELLADAKNWTRGTNARDAQGNEVSSLSEDAVCWCIYGAVTKCYINEGTTIPLKEISLNVPKGLVSMFNDSHAHEEVVALLKSLDV